MNLEWRKSGQIFLVMLEFNKGKMYLHCFALFTYLISIARSCKGLEKMQEMNQPVEDPTQDLVSYLKLYILMYADDMWPIIG